MLLLHVRHLHLLFLFSLFTAPHVCLLHLSFRALFATYLNIHFIVFFALIVLLERFFVIVSYSFVFLRKVVLVAIMLVVLVVVSLAHFNYYIL